MEEELCRSRDRGEMQQGTWGIGYGRVKGYGGGGWNIIKNKITSMESVEQNTSIGNNVINKYFIEDF